MVDCTINLFTSDGNFSSQFTRASKKIGFGKLIRLKERSARRTLEKRSCNNLARKRSTEL